MSIDLEDWFHLIDAGSFPEESWSKLGSQLEETTRLLLDFLDTHDIRASFFVLGWVADHYRDLVSEIAHRGHHVGCHSYAHRKVHSMTPSEFRVDLEKALTAIEKATGKLVDAYRAPGFSITGNSVWAFEILYEYGIKYDSSILPARHAYGGVPGAPAHPFLLKTENGALREFPVSTLSLLGMNVISGGGGYFRLIPLGMHRYIYEGHRKQRVPVVTYFHPRDFDSRQPASDLSLIRRLKSSINADRSLAKLDWLARNHEFTNLIELSNTYEWPTEPITCAATR